MKNKSLKHFLNVIISILAINIGTFVLLIIWWVVASLNLVDRVLLPTPVETFVSLCDALVSGSLLKDFGLTLYRSLYAFLIAIVIGISVGIVLGSSEKIYRSFEFLIDFFFRSTPATTMFPLFLILFGIGDFSKIAMAAFAGGLIIFFNTAYGVKNARKTRIMAAKVMGVSQWKFFSDVIFFESLPQTFIGLRTSISLTLVVIILAEMFVGSTNGMGQWIIDAQQVFDMPKMYASIIATGVMGYILNQIFLLIENKFVHWKGR